MSVKMKKSGMVIRWHKSFSILAPWRKGKDGDSVLDSAVVLTKMKLFSNVSERLLKVDDSSSSSSTSASEQKLSPHSKGSLVDTLSGRHQSESGEKYLSEILSGSQLTRLYKFQSEDSGVELSSGANSPSTPTGSEQNFIVHSRESSCDSSNLNSDPPTHSDKQTRQGQRSAIPQPEITRMSIQDNMLTPSNQLSRSALETDLHTGEVLEMDQCGVSQMNPEDTDKLEENTEDLKPRKQALTDTYNDKADTELESLKGSGTRDSLDKYMDECCRLSQVQQSHSNPLGSGLGYLEHICQLVERIGHLQETNLLLQKQICRLQKDCGMAKTKEDFFRHHCCCGAASLAFQDISEALSPGGTLSDLSTIPEATRYQLLSSRRDMSSLTPEALWRRSDHFHRDSTEGLSTVYRPVASIGSQMRRS
ncbi:uncharacterized protein si:ch211-250c4.3 isoform X2 [Dunckerocampus dactyliophorus]|uniref:uncharacterized protein si:ch211-250c4.3 isoform X2 n=1 Tax=Dunckerocampus dactyliophorus TaxID=161453 RepID=UPI002405E2C7|nr:uncharacterized protein si:ch211-250c4.3 isoform X2 [Dunckerocampus dactyliophorus]